MARAKCRICGEALDTKSAYMVVDNNRKAYYCSQEEYEADKARKEKTAADKNKVYRLICEIIGRKEIVNTVLYKEWSLWNKVASDETIGRYLEENITYLTSVISRLEDREFNRIRYLSAIIKNKIGDFKEQTKARNGYSTRVVVVDETLYESVSPRTNKRRSLADLEDDI